MEQKFYGVQTALWSALVVAGFARSATAQVPASAVWQTSIDGGATWLGGNTVTGATTAMVDVRLLLAWNAGSLPAFNLFSDARFDGVIENAGGLDSVQGLLVRDWSVMRPPTYPVSAQRFGSLIKIDAANDTFAPGAGPFGLSPNQNPSGLGQIPDMSNPVVVCSYRLVLDGSLGARTFSGAFNTYPGTSGPWLRVWGDSVQVQVSSLAQQPASIEVIPAPASVSLVSAGVLIYIRRRR